MREQTGVLATDLDGTFLPLEGHFENAEDLKVIQSRLHDKRIPLCFVTGRHFESIQNAMKEFHLPEPDWIICDVGSTIRRNNLGVFEIVKEYEAHLSEMIVEHPIGELRKVLSEIEQLCLQEDEKQGAFKLSYYVDQDSLVEAVAAIEAYLTQMNAPYSVIHSIDPFNGDGLIDLLPTSVSKAYALDWWSKAVGLPRETIVFAGDSGNDLAAMTAGFRTIVVGNASDNLVAQVKQAHERERWPDRLFHASKVATSGVLEGLIHFGLVSE